MINHFRYASFLFLLSLLIYTGKAQVQPAVMSPLSAYSTEWDKPVYAACNTAADASYMTAKEKEIIYIINLVRAYPEKFARLVLKQYPEKAGRPELANDTYYYQSLMAKLKKMEPLDILQPDNKCFISAKCHAYHSGIRGYSGHNRLTDECKKKKYYMGECCDYGRSDALDIVMSLLIDDGVPSLGHRTILLYGFTHVGVSVQPHRSYGTNAVLDFH